MSELACNIASYRPDPNMLAANFRLWHVEALLDQAATLIGRCLEDFRQYASLDYALHQFQSDLETQEKQLDLDKKRRAEGYFDREVATAQNRESHLEASPLEESKEEMRTRAVDAEEIGRQLAQATADASFRKSALEIRAEALQRKKELSAPGKPLALEEQRDLALKRLCRDYEQALNRACVAEEGLKHIYDHAEPTSPLQFADETLPASISNLAIWIRNCTEWLVRYQLQEQAFTRVVSVRSLLTRSTWVQLKQTRDSFSIKLQVPTDLFRGHDNCRMRGIGASLIGEAGTVPWSLTIRLPDEAVYERAGLSVEVDQSARPSCLLGRVENRRSVRPLELYGASSLINASPVGRSTPRGLWSLEIFKPAGASSESFSQLEDVLLEISAVGTPQKAKS